MVVARGTIKRSHSWAGASDGFERVGRRESPSPDSEVSSSPLSPKTVWASDTDIRLEIKSRGSRRSATLAGVSNPIEASESLALSSTKSWRRRSTAGLPRLPPDLSREVSFPSKLSSPRRVGPVPSRSDPCLEFFQEGLQGMRHYMEDRTLVVPQLPGMEDVALFGAFDGHGGAEVAQLASELLPRILVATLTRCREPQVALRESFLELDQEIRKLSRTAHGFDSVGSTANVVVALRRAGRLRLLCANCGDSRAVLSRGGVAVELSQDHLPLDMPEKRRIEAAGGQVVVYETTGRVDGTLAVSRALGDFRFKNNFDLPPERQKVSIVPDIKEIPVGKCDDFVAIGTDGVFSVFSSEGLVSALSSSRRAGQSWNQAIRSVLDKSAIGGDNASLCVAQFVH